MTEEQRPPAVEGSPPPDETLVREFQATRDQFLDVLTRMVKQEPELRQRAVAAKCGVGEVCHGGTF